MNVIVGSGPSGISAAKALLERGQSVLIIDGGEKIEPAIAEKVRAVASISDPKSRDFSFVKNNYSTDSSGIAEKYSFGSSYPFRSIPQQFCLTTENMGNVKPTLAVGGFSSIWGAACTAFYKDDIQDWPVNREELDPYYKKVSEFLGITGEPDSLSDQFGMSHFHRPAIPLGSGLEKLFRKMVSSKKYLSKKGLYFGKARIALDPSTCKSCGLCMYGCPWECIYSTASTLEEIKKNPLFSYRSGLLVKKFVENDQGVRIYFYNRETNRNEEMLAKKLFIGCGTLETTALVLNSLGKYDIPVYFKVSEYFLLPFLSYKGGSMDTQQVTLSQLFIEISNKSVSKFLVHMQLYGYNELFKQVIEKTLGKLYFLFKPFENAFLKRFSVVQGYLHSDDSSLIEGRLDQNGKFHLVGKTSEKTKKVLSRLKLFLFKQGFSLGFYPLLPLFKRGLPGDGRHLGGSFPMTLNPQGLQSDTLGRVDSLKKVHVIDSSLFPSIPATTITFTIMANAYRIAYNSTGTGGN